MQNDFCLCSNSKRQFAHSFVIRWGGGILEGGRRWPGLEQNAQTQKLRNASPPPVFLRPLGDHQHLLLGFFARWQNDVVKWRQYPQYQYSSLNHSRQDTAQPRAEEGSSGGSGSRACWDVTYGKAFSDRSNQPPFKQSLASAAQEAGTALWVSFLGNRRG